MPNYQEHKQAARAELKRLEKLEKKLKNLEKPRSWERFKAFFNGGTKKVTQDTQTAKNNLENQITQRTDANFLNQYRDEQARVKKAIDDYHAEKAKELNDVLDQISPGGKKQSAPKQQSEARIEIDWASPHIGSALKHPELKDALAKYSERDFSSENLKFYDAVESFKADVRSGEVSLEELKRRAQEIHDEFIATGAPQMVTIDNERVKSEIVDTLTNLDQVTSREELEPLFDRAQGEATHMLEGTLQRLQKTQEYGDLRARFEGPKQSVRTQTGIKTDSPKVSGSGQSVRH